MSTQPEALRLAEQLELMGHCHVENSDYFAAAAELKRLHARVQKLEASEPALVCYEAYQVVGDLLNQLGLFGTEQATKILDNLSQARMVHDDVLPWKLDAQRVPEGWQLVPIEPTPEMLDAGCDRKNGSQWVHRRVPRTYAAMLAAAPQPERPWESRQAETQLPTIAEMESKLKRRGWVLSCQIRDVATVWHKGDAEVLLPLSTNLKDYTARMRDAIKLIASAPQPETRES